MGCSDVIHGWMTGQMDETDGWMESFTKKDHDVL
jgi:hypothetical protein